MTDTDLPRRLGIPEKLRQLRPRTVPPVNDSGIFEIGSAHFRKHAAFYRDGTLHVVKEASEEVFQELQDLRRTWALPKVAARRPASPVDIAILYGRMVASDRRTGVDDLEPGARRFLSVLDEVSALGASDLKILMRQDHCDVRVKVADIERTHGDPWPVRDAAQAISWIYDERAKGDGSAAQQDGAHQPFAISSDNHIPLPQNVVGLRGQKGFIADGRDILVLRIFYSTGGHEAGNLETLGFDDDVLEVLAAERRSDNGLVIIGGSTGDGKSTTLVRQLERLYRDRRGEVSIYTIEDPVEYPIDGEGIAQMVVRAAASGEARSREFSEALRAFVRSNPDIGMVSEIRSVEDARRILQFVISGHKVFSTIHSFSARAIPFRLISLGVDPQELCEPGVLSLLMRQRLLPILCPDCARPANAVEAAHITACMTGDLSDTERRGIGGCGTFRSMVRNRAGCPTCLAGRASDLGVAAWGGLSRRRAVAEYIRVDDRFRRFIQDRDPLGAQDYWTRAPDEGGMGGLTLPMRVAALVAQGSVDYYDATRDERFAEVGERPDAGDEAATQSGGCAADTGSGSVG